MSKQLFTVKSRFIILLLIFSVSRLGIAGSIFTDSFESGNLSHTQGSARWYGSVRTSVTNAISHSGNYSLKYTFPAAELGKYSWAEQRFDLGNNYPEVWIQFYIYFPKGNEGVGPKYVRRLDQPGNDKVIRLWGASPRTDTSKITVTGGASTLNDGLGAKLEAEYATVYKGSIVKAMGRWGISPTPNLVNDNTLGTWIKLKFHRKVASKANNDAVLQWWINDVLVIDERGLTGYPGDGYLNAWTAGYLLGWSNTGFDKETNIYIDDIAFSTSNDFKTVDYNTVNKISPPMPPDAIK